MNGLIINCDGGSRGNPGPAAAAFVVRDSGKEIHSQSKFLGTTTNNVAEYSAVIMALDWLLHDSRFMSLDSVAFVLDSELIVRQINGVYKVKDKKLKELHAHVAQLLKKIDKKISFENVLREKNEIADELVNIELDKLS
ncbi:MAG: ribonuclease HI family protein [Patescibacteria group bacterium]